MHPAALKQVQNELFTKARRCHSFKAKFSREILDAFKFPWLKEKLLHFKVSSLSTETTRKLTELKETLNPLNLSRLFQLHWSTVPGPKKTLRARPFLCKSTSFYRYTSYTQSVLYRLSIHVQSYKDWCLSLEVYIQGYDKDTLLTSSVQERKPHGEVFHLYPGVLEGKFSSQNPESLLQSSNWVALLVPWALPA